MTRVTRRLLRSLGVKTGSKSDGRQKAFSGPPSKPDLSTPARADQTQLSCVLLGACPITSTYRLAQNLYLVQCDAAKLIARRLELDL